MFVAYTSDLQIVSFGETADTAVHVTPHELRSDLKTVPASEELVRALLKGDEAPDRWAIVDGVAVPKPADAT